MVRKPQLSSHQPPYSWVLWAFEWSIPGAGKYELVVRATDEKGRTQPAERATDRADGYEVKYLSADPGDCSMKLQSALSNSCCWRCGAVCSRKRTACWSRRMWLSATGDQVRSAALAQRVLARNPKAVHAHMILGVIAAQKKDWNDVEQALSDRGQPRTLEPFRIFLSWPGEALSAAVGCGDPVLLRAR